MSRLLLRLRLLYGPDRVLNLSVSLPNDLLRLLARLLQDLLPHLLDLLQLLLIPLGYALEGLVSVLDALEPLIDGPAVPRDLAQIALDADKLLAGPGLRILDDILRQSGLPRQLEGERVARQPHLQLEERSDVLHVEHHRAVDHSCLS